METLLVELLGGRGKFAVVKLPYRAYPGIVIQGDTLNALYQDIAKVVARLRDGGPADLAEDLSWVEERLGEALAYYETVLQENEVDLPY